MWPGLADNDGASSPKRARDNQGFWEREASRESGGERRERERGRMRPAMEGRRWRERAGRRRRRDGGGGEEG